MTVDELRLSKIKVLECISGSRSYGLATATSDTDIRGVYIVPRQQYYGLEYPPQISNETNDIVFYELHRLFELLYRNNPNILELLSVPEDCVLYRHPLLSELKAELFLSRLCNDSFAKYAYSQIKKAKGLNKKVLNPMEKERKTILHFCHIIVSNQSVPLLQWLADNDWRQEQCGLTAISHVRDTYALYYSPIEGLLKGIMYKEDSNDVSLSSVARGMEPMGTMYFNRDGYSQYCKTYREYWQWVDDRNEVRYENTLEHGKNYDAKNMMHVFRLLDMAEEIARYQKVIVRRPNREYLLQIKAGEFLYEDLLQQAEERIARVNELFEISALPPMPDRTKVEELLISIRERFYTTG
ncbi:MAG: nucleotidyltransferase domain-containing protein [Bacteroidetes bacterium]|nr:nucleotidyltransferase domain-containing protein [Bacteroidota bacterium]